jgi:hypothetical protein
LRDVDDETGSRVGNECLRPLVISKVQRSRQQVEQSSIVACVNVAVHCVARDESEWLMSRTERRLGCSNVPNQSSASD